MISSGVRPILISGLTGPLFILANVGFPVEEFLVVWALEYNEIDEEEPVVPLSLAGGFFVVFPVPLELDEEFSSFLAFRSIAD